MALVDYGSDSSASESGINRRPLKRKRSIRSDNEGSLPPLPSSFRDLYSASVRTSKIDDPSLHGGRQRVVPHIAGNWPTHVYTECKFLRYQLLCRLYLVLTRLRATLPRRDIHTFKHHQTRCSRFGSGKNLTWRKANPLLPFHLSRRPTTATYLPLAISKS